MLKIYGYILATCLLVAYVSAETFDNRTTPHVANPLPVEGTGSTIKLIYGGTPGSSSTTATTSRRPSTPSKPTVISPARQGLTPGQSSSSTVSRPATPVPKSPTPARQGQTPGGSTTSRPPTPTRSSSKRPTPTAPAPSGSTTSRRPTPGNVYQSTTTRRVTPTNPPVTGSSASVRVTPSGPSTTTSILTPSPSMSPSTTPAFTSPTETTGMPSGPTTGSELPSSSTGGMPSTTSPELSTSAAVTTSSPMVSTSTPMVSTTSPPVSTTSPQISTTVSESPSSSPMPTTTTPASTTTPVTTSISSSTTMVPTSSTMPSTSSAPTSSSTMPSSSASSESSSASVSSSGGSSSSSPSSSTSPSSTTPSTTPSSTERTATTPSTSPSTSSTTPSITPTSSTTLSTSPSTSASTSSSTLSPGTNTPSPSSSTVTPTTSTQSVTPSYPISTPSMPNGGGPLTHVQIMFCDKYRGIYMPQDTVQLTAYLYQLQLAISSFCGVGYGRIGNVYLVEDPSTGNPVIQFDVLPGPGMSTTDIVLMISNEVNKGTFKLTDKNGYTYNVNCPLPMYPMYPWTDYGPCPKLPCKNNGKCMVAITGHYFCECPAGWTGELCDKRVEPAQQKDNLWLLWLLIVPLALLALLLLLCCFCCCHRCCWWGAAAPQQKVQIIEEDIYQDVPACSERGTVRSCRSACSGRPSIYAIDPVSSPMCVNDAGSTYYSALGRPFAVAFSDNTFSAVGYASNDMGIYNSSGKKMLAPSSCCGDGEIEVIMNGAGRRGSRCGSMYSDAGSGYHSAMGNRYAVAYNDRSFNTYSSMPRVGSIRHYN